MRAQKILSSRLFVIHVLLFSFEIHIFIFIIGDVLDAIISALSV